MLYAHANFSEFYLKLMVQSSEMIYSHKIEKKANF